MEVERFDPYHGALGFSLATRVGSLVYTAGMIGFDEATGTSGRRGTRTPDIFLVREAL